jgi:hypothetical protein
VFVVVVVIVGGGGAAAVYFVINSVWKLLYIPSYQKHNAVSNCGSLKNDWYISYYSSIHLYKNFPGTQDIILWVVIPCSDLIRYQHFGGPMPPSSLHGVTTQKTT